jgi:rhamnogalacturonyl hydrolase YesR
MRLYGLIASAFALTTSGHSDPHQRNESSRYSLEMAKSIMSRHQGILASMSDRSSLLQAGFVQKAFREVVRQYSNHTSTPSINSYIQASVDFVVPTLSNATLDTSYPLDRLSSGNGLINAYQQTKNGTYRKAYEALRTSVDLQHRNAEGSLWYYVYPNYTYLDGMYSLAPFLTLYSTIDKPENSSVIDDVTLQLDLLWNHTHTPSGLLVHGYDASRRASWANNATGASPHVWGRSLGWYCMALIDTLSLLPESAVTARTWLRGHFQGLMKSVVNAVDEETGAWWQVLDQPGRGGNYIESSASAMFVYSILKGLRAGYLKGQDCDYEKIANRAYGYLADSFVVQNANRTLAWNGTVGVCSLNSTASYEVRYVHPSIDREAEADVLVAVLRWSANSIQQRLGVSSICVGVAGVRKTEAHWLNDKARSFGSKRSILGSTLVLVSHQARICRASMSIQGILYQNHYATHQRPYQPPFLIIQNIANRLQTSVVARA